MIRKMSKHKVKISASFKQKISRQKSLPRLISYSLIEMTTIIETKYLSLHHNLNPKRYNSHFYHEFNHKKTLLSYFITTKPLYNFIFQMHKFSIHKLKIINIRVCSLTIPYSHFKIFICK